VWKIRNRFEYFDVATPLTGSAATSVARATVLQAPVLVRLWIRATLPLWAGMTVPENLTRWPLRGFAVLTPRLTLTRTRTAV